MSTPPTTGNELDWRELGDHIVATLHWKLFFAFVSCLSAVISIRRDVSAEDRNFWLGILALAAVVAVVLLARDVIRWLRGNYVRDNAYQANAKLVGVGYESLEITAWLKSDGSMTITRHCTLKAFADTVEKLDFYMFAREAPEGKDIRVAKATSFPAKVYTRVFRGFGASKESAATVTVDFSDRSKGRLVSILTFTPSISRHQVVEFDYVEELPIGSFALVPAKIQTGLGYEFVAWDITRPTRTLKLDVFFPSDVTIALPEYDVWYGMAKLRHQREYGSICGGWTNLIGKPHPHLVLEVPGPTMGLSYLVRWWPADPQPTTAQA